MILFGALGYAAYRWLHWRSGVLIGVLAGMIIANFVPVNTACAIRSDDDA